MHFHFSSRFGYSDFGVNKKRMRDSYAHYEMMKEEDNYQ
ncbi:hypothetical protein [Halobacillus karajensis]